MKRATKKDKPTKAIIVPPLSPKSLVGKKLKKCVRLDSEGFEELTPEREDQLVDYNKKAIIETLMFLGRMHDKCCYTNNLNAMIARVAGMDRKAAECLELNLQFVIDGGDEISAVPTLFAKLTLNGVEIESFDCHLPCMPRH